MSIAESAPNSIAMIFDPSPKCLYLPMVTEVAEEMGWQTVGYDIEDYALQDIDPSVSALIAVPDYRSSSLYKGEALLQCAYNLEVPTAVITKRRYNEWIRPNSSSILLANGRRQQLPPQLSSWFTKLSLSESINS